MNALINKHITNIYNQLVSDIHLRIVSITRSIRTIIIIDLPPHVLRYFTKIILNYNPINNKIHLRTDSADEDIAKTFSIINNDKQFNNGHEVIAFLNSIMQQKHCGKDYKGKYYKYKQKYLQLLEQKQKL
jgi:hypothetical protein